MCSNNENVNEYCKRCSKDITKEKVKPKGYCFDCCITLGDKASSKFLKLIEENPPNYRVRNKHIFRLWKVSYICYIPMFNCFFYVTYK